MRTAQTGNTRSNGNRSHRAQCSGAAVALVRPLFGRPSDGLFALLLVAISAAGSLGLIVLSLAGQLHIGLQLAAGAVLLILALLMA